MTTFTIEYNGLTIGNDTDYVVTLLDTGNVEYRLAQQMAYNRDGGFIFNSNAGMRNLSFDVELISQTEEDFFTKLRAFKKAYSTKELNTLTINYWDGTSRNISVYSKIIPSNTHLPFSPSNSKFKVELISPSPYFEPGASDVVQETLTLVQSSGIDLPTDLPASFASGGNENRFVFNNNGDTSAKLKVEFSGPVINPTILNSSTGKVLQIEKTLAANEVITIEYSAQGRVVENKSGISQEEFFNGDTNALFIPEGSNTFLFSASTFDVNASCTLYLTKRLIS